VPRVAVIPCSMRVRHNEGPLCLQQARRQLGLDMIYNSMEVSVQRWVIDMLEIVRASERERARCCLFRPCTCEIIIIIITWWIFKTARLAFESTQTNRIIERLFGFIYCSWKCLGLHWVWRERVRIESMDSWVLSQRNAILSRVCLECGLVEQSSLGLWPIEPKICASCYAKLPSLWSLSKRRWLNFQGIF